MAEFEDDRPVAMLRVSELRAIIRDELEAVLGESRGPVGLLTVAELATLLRISERTLADLRGYGLPTVWVTPDAPRFERAEALAWIRGFGAWMKAGAPADWTFDADGFLVAKGSAADAKK
jgi:hypothetical protein